MESQDREEFNLDRLVQQAKEEQAKQYVNEFDDFENTHKIREAVSGSDATEADENQTDDEMELIFELDQIMKQFVNSPSSTTHHSIFMFFQKLEKVYEVVDLDSEIMKKVFEETIAPTLPNFTDVDKILTIVKVAVNIGLKNHLFWNSVVHTFCVTHHENDIGDNLNFLYLIYKHDININLKVDKSLLDGSNMTKERVYQRLAHSKIISSLNEEISVEVSELESSTAFNMLNLFQILFLKQAANLDLISMPNFYALLSHMNETLQGQDDLKDTNEYENELINNYIEGLSQFTKSFTLMHCLDLLKIITNEEVIEENVKDNSLLLFVIYQIIENAKEKEFYKGAIITYNDVQIMLRAIRDYKIQGEELVDACSAAEILLSKAITLENSFSKLMEETTEIVETGGKLAHSKESNKVAIIEKQTAELQTLTKIMIHFDHLIPPSIKVFALLAFEADYIIKHYLSHPLAEKTEFGIVSQDKSLNVIPKEISKSYIQFHYLISKSLPLDDFSDHTEVPKVIKRFYLRLINLLLHNESFQEQADEHCFVSLKRIQGLGIVDEEMLDKVLNLLKLRIHTYKTITGMDGSF